MLLSQARSAAASGSSRPSAADVRDEVLADLATLVSGDLPATAAAALALVESEQFLPASTLATTRGWIRAAAQCESKRKIAALRLGDLPPELHVCFYEANADQAKPVRIGEVKISDLHFDTNWARMSDILAAAADAAGIEGDPACGFAIWRQPSKG